MTDVRLPSAGDCCFYGARDPDEFDRNGLTNEQTLVLLKYNQTGVVTIIFLALIVLVLWSIASIVPGFARFDGAAGETSAISHIGWWIAIEIFVLVVGAMSTFFGLHYTKEGAIEKGVGRVRSFLTFYIFVLAIAIAANITHLVLSGLELSNCTSTLCTSQKGFLIALLVILAVLAFLEGWQIYRVVTYSNNLFNSLGNGKGSYTIKESDPLESLNAPVRINMTNYGVLPQVQTPLLQKIATENKNRSRGVHALKNK